MDSARFSARLLSHTASSRSNVSARFETLSATKNGTFEELGKAESSFRVLSRAMDREADEMRFLAKRRRQLARSEADLKQEAYEQRAEAERLICSGVVREYTYGPLDYVPLRKQGNLALYADEALRQRRAVLKNADFLRLCRTLWALVETQGELRKDMYMEMVIRFNFCVCPLPENVEASAERDWRADAGRKRALDYDDFLNCIWEAVDVWTSSCEAAEYIELLQRLIAATPVAHLDGTLAFKGRAEITFDSYFEVPGDAKARAEALRRRGEGQQINKRFGAAVFIQRNFLARRVRRAATRLQAQTRRRRDAKKAIRLNLGQLNALIGRIYAKHVDFQAANRRRLRTDATKDDDLALRFDAFCLRFFKTINTSAERAHAHLKIFVDSVEDILYPKRAATTVFEQKQSIVAHALANDTQPPQHHPHLQVSDDLARLANFADFVGVGVDIFNARLMSEYGTAVLERLYLHDATSTLDYADKLVCGPGKNAVAVEVAKMRGALLAAIPKSFRSAEAVKSLVSAALDAATVERGFVNLDVALRKLLLLFTRLDLFFAKRRTEAARVIGQQGREFTTRQAEYRCAKSALESLGSIITRVNDSKCSDMGGLYTNLPALDDEDRSVASSVSSTNSASKRTPKKKKRALSARARPGDALVGSTTPRSRTSRDGKVEKRKRPSSAPGRGKRPLSPSNKSLKPVVQRAKGPRSPMASPRNQTDNAAENNVGKNWNPLRVSPRRRLDEALWRDLELNGGTESILFTTSHSQREGLLAALEQQ